MEASLQAWELVVLLSCASRLLSLTASASVIGMQASTNWRDG